MKKQNISVIIGIIVALAIIFFVMNGGKMNKVAVFDTTEGSFKVELYEDKAPITAGNFIKLAESGFYDGTRFHRVIERFMIQGGDPLSKDISNRNLWGTGGPGYAIEDEFHPELKNVVGTISMANSGPNTGGSQFFINVFTNIHLDGKHAVFGKVIEGYEVVEKISKVEKNQLDQPSNDVIINKITIE